MLVSYVNGLTESSFLMLVMISYIPNLLSTLQYESQGKLAGVQLLLLSKQDLEIDRT